MEQSKDSYDDVIVERDVSVEMRDGVNLCVDVFRPADSADEPVPALMAMSPYGKNIQRDIVPQPVPSPLGDACIEAGDTETILERGYAHVIVDCRGTGSSDGAYRAMYDEQDGEDGHDTVEWIADQSWCDGSVGMIGISYYGTVQLVVAAEQPEHLDAIAPFEATTNQYLACYHGGVLDGFYSELFTGRHSTVSWSGFQPTNVESWSRTHLDDEELQERVEARKADPDLRQYNLLFSTLDCPEKNPIFFDIMLHQYADSDYWYFPDLESIDVPVLCGNAWYPDCGPKFVRGPFQIWDRVSGPTKMKMVPPGWLERPFHQYHETILDWHDYWLKGVDNGVVDEDPIELYVMGDEGYRSETEWPLERTEWTDFYLHPHQELARDPVSFDDLEPDAFVQEPLSVTQEINTVTYESSPMPEPMEVTGPITLYLHSAIDSEDSMFRVKLYDVAPSGETHLLTHGHLQLSHRALDEERTTHYQPYHEHTRDAVEPVEPGAINEYRIELYPFSKVFDQGHTLRLEIASVDIPGEQFSYHVARHETVTHRIYRDNDHPSRLHLPVIPR
jgi:putative CocE/NonD family hydrolase